VGLENVNHLEAAAELCRACENQFRDVSYLPDRTDVVPSLPLPANMTSQRSEPVCQTGKNRGGGGGSHAVAKGLKSLNELQGENLELKIWPRTLPSPKTTYYGGYMSGICTTGVSQYIEYVMD
jgi:hypothetical protein